MPDISIIIVNYSTEELIANCIRSIEELTKDVFYEIIIVDNASPDNSFRKLKELYKNNNSIKCMALKENVGFGRANNAGYELSSGRNIFCLNPDTKLKNNAIAILSHYLDTHNNVGACGGNLYHDNGRLCTSFRMLLPSIWWEISFLTNYFPEKILFGKNRRFNTSNHVIQVATITGADLMIRRSVIEEIGFFDSDFFMYYEDTELCFRIKKNRYSLMNIPEAQIYHYEGKSTKNLGRKAKYNYDGRELFFKKHRSKVHHVIADIVFAGSVALRYLVTWYKKDPNKEYWSTLLRLMKNKYW